VKGSVAPRCATKAQRLEGPPKLLIPGRAWRRRRAHPVQSALRMNCLVCSADIEPGAELMPSRWESSATVLKSWRWWGLIIAEASVCGLIAGSLGVSRGIGTAGGMLLAILINTQRAKLRKCPKCSAIFQPPDTASKSAP
jgi:hypothetical protein